MMIRGWLYRAEALAIILLAVLAIATELPRIISVDSLWDFGSFVASGRAAREGMNPYGVYPPLTPHVVLDGFDSWNPNLNPPVSALLFRLFDLVDPNLGVRVWRALSVGCYAAAVLLLLRRYGDQWLATMAVWAFALAGFWDTLFLGQIYLPLVLATAAAWLLLERGAGVWAGILIGFVVAMKPNFLVWPGLLLLAGHYRPAVSAIVTAAVISAVPLIVLGPEVYRQWFELIASDRDRAVFPTKASITGLAARLDVPAVGLALSLLLLAVAALWAFRSRPAAMRASALALLAALLASPIAWIHYTLFLLPVFFQNWSLRAVRLLALLLIVPVPFIIDQVGQPTWIQVTIGSAYSWALLLCLLILLLPAGRHTEGRAVVSGSAGRPTPEML